MQCLGFVAPELGRRTGSSGPAELLWLLRMGNGPSAGVGEHRARGGSGDSVPLAGGIRLHSGHWVRMNFIPGKPQSHTVWSAACPAREAGEVLEGHPARPVDMLPSL